jgi:hypothetical protein
MSTFSLKPSPSDALKTQGDDPRLTKDGVALTAFLLPPLEVPPRAAPPPDNEPRTAGGSTRVVLKRALGATVSRLPDR